ncbi:hypothetical protein [Deinococcus budaensis]|uniref:Holin n=1 Tax=Deinococcus budaensis TaxID=1665626 RepID=A0A7W8LQ76_9DEIO|nr:hypothetical protein [Deinococcus budaensis]MBB5234531.1 hypothetical protein [Deinococcus budaensis]
MTDPLPLSSSFAALLPVLGPALLAGTVTQLARQLARPEAPPLRRLLALAAAAGIAALTVTALLSVWLRPPPAPALLLAAACITGWSGPGILTRLGALIERKLGLPEGRPGPAPKARPGTYSGDQSGHTEL